MKDRCLETRQTFGGLVKLRRYETPDGVRYTTYEIPSSVLRAMSRKHLDERLAKASRGHEAKVKWARSRARIETLLQQGWKSEAIAEDAGVSVSLVRKVRTQLKRRKQP